MRPPHLVAANAVPFVLPFALAFLASGCFGGGCWEVANPCSGDPLGCSDDPNARLERDLSCPELSAPLTVALGEDRGGFRRFDAASPLPFVWGSQGGGHVEVGYAVGGLAYAAGGGVRGLRVSLRLDETIPCALAGEGDLRLGSQRDASSGDAHDDVWTAWDEGSADDEAPAEAAAERCLRTTAQRVILYGTPALPLTVDANGGRAETGLILFVNGFGGPQMPARLEVVAEDTCGRTTTASHVFAN